MNSTDQKLVMNTSAYGVYRRCFVLLIIWAMLGLPGQFSSAVSAQSNNTVYLLAWSPDGHYIAEATQNGGLRLWNADASQIVLNLLTEGGSSINALSWNSNSTALAASSGKGGFIRVWNIPTGEVLVNLAVEERKVTLVEWSPTGTTLAGALLGETSIVRSWHFDGGFTQMAELSEGAIYDMAWNPGGTQILAVAHFTPYKISDANQASPTISTFGPYTTFLTVSWSKDGQFIAGGDPYGKILIWDAQTGVTQHVLDAHTDVVSYLDWSPNGDFLASIGYDKTLRIWDTRTLFSNRAESVQSYQVISLASVVQRRGEKFTWRPDGRQIAYSDGTGGIKFLNFDWPPSAAASAVGIFKAGNWWLGKPAGQSGDYGYVWYGGSSSIPVVGDWDGDGKDSPGIYNNGDWWLRSDYGEPFSEEHVWYGGAGWTPVAGDWDGDGKDSPGIFQAGNWWLLSDVGESDPEGYAWYGDATSIPVVGDWDGDGKDSPGIYKAGDWWLRSDVGESDPEQFAFYGDATWKPVPGDWNGDGKDAPGVFKDGVWWLRVDLGASGNYAQMFYGDGTWTPIAGDWDGE